MSPRASDGPERDRDGSRTTEWTEAARRRYDPEADDSLAVTLAVAIAEVQGVPPSEIPPVARAAAVDPEALDAAFFGPMADDDQSSATAEFRYREYLLRVRGDGHVRVFERASARP